MQPRNADDCEVECANDVSCIVELRKKVKKIKVHGMKSGTVAKKLSNEERNTGTKL